VFREVVRLAAIIRKGFDADDIAASVAEDVLRQPEVIMARYPDPTTYARHRTRHAGISFDRGQRVQRGEGARLFGDSSGKLQPGRRWISGNTSTIEGGADLFSQQTDHASSFEAAADDKLFAHSLLRTCCRDLSLAEIHEVWMVDGCGCTVQEVAAMRGQSRETISRRLNATRRRIHENRTEMLATVG